MIKTKIMKKEKKKIYCKDLNQGPCTQKHYKLSLIYW
jgi:hypothetical protein